MHKTDGASKLEFPGGDETDLSHPSPTSTWDTIHYELSRMPDRRILDVLVQYFMCELNWQDSPKFNWSRLDLMSNSYSRTG